MLQVAVPISLQNLEIWEKRHACELVGNRKSPKRQKVFCSFADDGRTLAHREEPEKNKLKIIIGYHKISLRLVNYIQPIGDLKSGSKLSNVHNSIKMF